MSRTGTTAAPASARPPSERRVLAAVISVTTAGVLPVFLFGGLAVQVRGALHLSTSTQGVVTFGYFAVSAAASATSGRLTERFGPSRSMRAAALLGSASALLVASAGSFAVLVVALGLGGLSNALGQPAANALVVRMVPLRRQGLALGVKQAAIPTATLLAGLAVPSLGLTVGWRWAFVGAGLLAASATLLVPSIDAPARAAGGGRRRLELKLGPLAVLALGVGLGSAMANALGAFTTTTAVRAGISEGAAGALLAVGSAVGLTLRIGSGWMADRRGDDHLLTVAVMLGGGAVGLLGIASRVPWVLVVGTLLAFGSGWSWPGVFNLAVVNHHPTAPAAATGLTQTGSYTGGALGPLLMGALVDHQGDATAWLVFTAIAVASGAVMLVARRMLAGRDAAAEVAVVV